MRWYVNSHAMTFFDVLTVRQRDVVHVTSTANSDVQCVKAVATNLKDFSPVMVVAKAILINARGSM